MSSRTLAVLVSLGTVLVGGCTAAEPSLSPVEPVVVGVLVDSTDDGPGAGADAVRGGELAVELVNGSYPELDLPLASAAGLPGLGGAKLRVEVSETGGDPDAAEAATDRLLASGHVVGIVAADDADVVTVAAAYATRKGVPTVDAAASAQFLLDLGLEWYFRIGPTDRMLAEAVFALLATQPPPGDGRAVVLTAASESGVGAASETEGLARAAGLTVTDTIPVGGAGDFDAAIRLTEAAPDLAVAVADTEAGARQLRDLLSELDSPPPVVELGAGHRQLAGGPVGAVRPVGWSDEFAARHPLAQAVSGLYEERFGQPMTGSAAAGFTGVMTLAVAAAASGDPAAVRVALRQLDVPATGLVMPWRGIRFRPNGQNGSAGVVVEQRTGQGWQVVFPPELASAPVAWPSRQRGETGL